jgi:hypothetical protein
MRKLLKSRINFAGDWFLWLSCKEVKLREAEYWNSEIGWLKSKKEVDWNYSLKRLKLLKLSTGENRGIAMIAGLKKFQRWAFSQTKKISAPHLMFLLEKIDGSRKARVWSETFEKEAWNSKNLKLRCVYWLLAVATDDSLLKTKFPTIVQKRDPQEASVLLTAADCFCWHLPSSDCYLNFKWPLKLRTKSLTITVFQFKPVKS